jgi:hypothetical protein
MTLFQNLIRLRCSHVLLLRRVLEGGVAEPHGFDAAPGHENDAAQVQSSFRRLTVDIAKSTFSVLMQLRLHQLKLCGSFAGFGKQKGVKKVPSFIKQKVASSSAFFVLQTRHL